MKKYLILIIGLFVCSSAFGQSKSFSPADTLYLASDTSHTIFFTPPPNTIFTSFVLVADTTFYDTVEVLQETERADTIPQGFRLLEDFSGTADFSQFVYQEQRSRYPKKAKEYMILNPTTNKLIFRLKGIDTNSLTPKVRYIIYLRKNKLAG